LSYSKVRALTRVATPETEERLLAVGRAGTAEHVELIVRGWRRMDAKAEALETARRHRNRALHVYPDADGMVVIRGRLEPEVGAVVMRALAAARDALSRVPAGTGARDVPAGTSVVAAPPPTVVDGSPDAPTMEQQQADALALVAETALHRGIDPGAPGERYQVVVHVDAQVLADADAPGPVGARRGCTRSRRNVSTLGVRCQPRGDAIRRRWADHRGRRPHTHDSTGVTARASASRQRLSVPGLRTAVRTRPPHQALGAWRTDEAVKSDNAVSQASPCGPRRGLSG